MFHCHLSPSESHSPVGLHVLIHCRQPLTKLTSVKAPLCVEHFSECPVLPSRKHFSHGEHFNHQRYDTLWTYVFWIYTPELTNLLASLSFSTDTCAVCMDRSTLKGKVSVIFTPVLTSKSAVLLSYSSLFWLIPPEILRSSTVSLHMSKPPALAGC